MLLGHEFLTSFQTPTFPFRRPEEENFVCSSRKERVYY